MTTEPYRAAWNAYLQLVSNLINVHEPRLTPHGLAEIRRQLRPGGEWQSADAPLDLIDQHVMLLSNVSKLYAFSINMPMQYFAEDIVP
jgi:hypothetical protein